MALMTRVSRLFRADLHAVLDRLEEPDILLRQAVREMEEELSREEQRLRMLQHDHDEMLKRESDLHDSLGEIEQQLDVCFASGKDDLARPLIKRKLETQRLNKMLAAKRASLLEALARLRVHLDENRTRLEATRQKLELLVENDRPPPPEDNWTVPDFSVHEEDVEVAFLREKQKRSRS